MRLLILILIVFMSTPAFSAEAWKGYSKITKLYPNDSGITFFLDGNSINPDGACETNRMHLYTTQPNYEISAAALLAAFSQNRQISVNYDTTTLLECAVKVNRFFVLP